VLDARIDAYAALCGLVSMGLRLDAEADRIAALRPAAASEDKPAARVRKVLRSRWLESGVRSL
jgi:hypothetical protein